MCDISSESETMLPYDVLFIPGGMGTRPLQNDAAFVKRLDGLAKRATLVFMVVTLFVPNVFCVSGVLHVFPIFESNACLSSTFVPPTGLYRLHAVGKNGLLGWHFCYHQ